MLITGFSGAFDSGDTLLQTITWKLGREESEVTLSGRQLRVSHRMLKRPLWDKAVDARDILTWG